MTFREKIKTSLEIVLYQEIPDKTPDITQLMNIQFFQSSCKIIGDSYVVRV